MVYDAVWSLSMLFRSISLKSYVRPVVYAENLSRKMGAVVHGRRLGSAVSCTHEKLKEVSKNIG